MSQARAATFSVINNKDSGTGSLRQAILNVNGSAGDDTITFDIPGSGPHTITLTAALPALASNTSIINDRSADEQVTVMRSTAAGTPEFGIFSVAPGVNVLIAGLIVTRGSSGVGGAIYFFDSTVTVRRCHISSNIASNSGGGIIAFGSANLTVIDSYFSGNKAENSFGGRLGGAIDFDGSGMLVVSNCTFHSNTAGVAGAILNSAAAVVTNTTFIDNMATIGGGGGIAHSGDQNLTLKHCTFSGNSAVTSGGAISNSSGGSVQAGNNIFVAPAGEGTIENSASFISTGRNLSNEAAGGDTNTGPGGFLSGPGDKRNTNPMLGALGNYGGFTPTMPLLAGSPAIDAGTADGLPADQRGFARPTDNPAVANTGGSDGSDIGAFEAGLPQNGPAFTVTNTTTNDNGCTTDDCSLLEAIKAANATGNTNTIMFASGVAGTIVGVPAGGIFISAPVNIVGPGARQLAISGNNLSRIFVITASDVSISGLTLTGGRSINGGAIFNAGSAANTTLTDCTISRSTVTDGGNGGGLYNNGTVTLLRCTFVSNTVSAVGFGGGAVFNGGTLTATNCTFVANTAPRGGAILSISNNATSLVTLRNCTIASNTATSSSAPTDGGGGYYGEGAVGNSLHRFSNTILANNNNAINPDLRGYGTSEGNNLIGDLGQHGSGFSNGVNGDKEGVPAGLNAFGDNGGPTDTLNLFSNSPAINAGNNALAPSTDQRGYGRKGASDIGAFEFEGLAPSTLANISTRLRVLGGDKNLIGGMIATGNTGKKVIIRGIGPTLTDFGLPGALPDPKLDLFQGNALIASNDNWKLSSQQGEIASSGFAPGKDAESAIIVTLTPNQNYTAIVSGKNGQTGIGVVEAFDLDRSAASKLANISTRGFVDLDDNRMIAGLIVAPAGGGSTKVLVRALGPTLGDFGVQGFLANPKLDLVNASGTVLRSNDSWKSSQAAQIQAANLAPKYDAEAALIHTLPPGQYTAIVTGVARTMGVGLVEVYNIE